MTVHRCHAVQCNRAVPPKMFMCKRHWFMLPKAMRDRVWEHYVPGQEVRKDPTEEYLFVTLECVNYVARMEGL